MSELTTLLQSAGIEIRLEGRNVGAEMVNLCCPFCNEGKFHCGIHESKLWFHCFVCSTGGGWGKMASQLKKTYPSTNWRSIGGKGGAMYLDKPEEKPEVKEDPIYWRDIRESDQPLLDWLSEAPDMEFIKDKYRERGIPLELAMDAGLMIGVGHLRGYIVFKSGENIIARKYHEPASGPVYWRRTKDNPYLFGAEWVLKTAPRIGYVTEGIFDCLRVPVGYGIAILGSSVSEALADAIAGTFTNADHIVLALDRDANRGPATQLHLLLADLGYQITHLDWSLIPEQGIKDIDELYLARGADYLYEFLGCSGVSVPTL